VAARSAKLSKDKRDLFRWFDTSLWQDPATGKNIAAQAPFTLRNFPTRFPDVRFSDHRPLVCDFHVPPGAASRRTAAA